MSNTNRFIKATKNNIWIAGDNGIQYFNTTESTFKNLTKNEGIVSYNYNGLEIIDNNVFVCTQSSLNPNNLYSNCPLAFVLKPIAL